MKLKNKQTGKVQTMDFAVISDDYRRDGELAKLNSHIFIFRSIKQLTDEYEDYKPTEPLIKDEQVRKAVRAWAGANAPTIRLKFDEDNARLSSETSCIEFDDYQPFARLKDDEEYTIAALCGEEDEDEA